MNIELHIERLILDGLSVEPRHHAEFQAAVEMELTRLLGVKGLRSELMSEIALRSMRAGTIEVSYKTDASHLGSRIAGAVHAQIGNKVADGQVDIGDSGRPPFLDRASPPIARMPSAADSHYE